MSSHQQQHTAHHNNTNIPLLTAAFLASLTTGGPTYAFGLYGAALKTSLHLTQSQLDTLSSANFCAGFFTWVPGLLVDKFGVRTSMMAGGLLGAIFMTWYWWIAKQILVVEESLILPLLCVFGILIFMSNGLVIGAIYKVLVCTCAPTTKGSAVGVAKGYVGLGSGVYAVLFQAVKAMLISHTSSNTTTTTTVSDLDFLPMAAILAVVACTLPAYLFLPDKETMKRLMQIPPKQLDKCTPYHLGLLYTALFALGILVVGTSLSELFVSSMTDDDDSTTTITNLRPTFSHVSRGWLIFAVWFVPILVFPLLPISFAPQPGDDIPKIQLRSMNNNKGTEEEGTEEDTEACSLITKDKSLLFTQRSELMDSTVITDDNKQHLFDTEDDNSNSHPKQNYNLMELLQTPPAWLLAWCGIVMVGGGTMMTNNMGQMVESLYFRQETITPASMAMFSVAQAASRILTGAISDRALTWHVTSIPCLSIQGVPRPAFLVVAALVGALAHTVLALATSQGWFIIGVCMAGIAFGMIWPLMVLIVGEVFGTEHMATNYLFYDGTASAMGTLLLSKFVTQAVYEEHTVDGEYTCYGQACFQGSHWIVVGVSISCIVAGYQMLKQTRHAYLHTHSY